MDPNQLPPIGSDQKVNNTGYTASAPEQKESNTHQPPEQKSSNAAPQPLSTEAQAYQAFWRGPPPPPARPIQNLPSRQPPPPQRQSFHQTQTQRVPVGRGHHPVLQPSNSAEKKQ